MCKIRRHRKYIADDVFSEADLRLFSTLVVRWDYTHFVHFKCCFRRIQDYPNLSQYVRRIHEHKEIQRRDIPFEYTRWHYYQDHRSCNPHGIAPLGPYVWDDLEKPRDRGDIDFAKYHNLSETLGKLRGLEDGEDSAMIIKLKIISISNTSLAAI